MEVRAPSIGTDICREVRPVPEIPQRRLTGTMSHGGYMSLPFRCSLRTVLLVQSNQLSFLPCNSVKHKICSAPLTKQPSATKCARFRLEWSRSRRHAHRELESERPDT